MKSLKINLHKYVWKNIKTTDKISYNSEKKKKIFSVYFLVENYKFKQKPCWIESHRGKKHTSEYSLENNKCKKKITVRKDKRFVVGLLYLYMIHIKKREKKNISSERKLFFKWTYKFLLYFFLLQNSSCELHFKCQTEFSDFQKRLCVIFV